MFVYLKLSGSLRVRSCLPVSFSSVCFNHVHVIVESFALDGCSTCMNVEMDLGRLRLGLGLGLHVVALGSHA
jgi:hypothetical protein